MAFLTFRIYALYVIFQLVSCDLKHQFHNVDGDFYSHDIKDSSGRAISLEKYRGSVTLVVNVASECGFTDKHYKQLPKLQDLMSTRSGGKFSVLAFPCNQFGEQEPQGSPEIVQWAKDTYNVNFPIFGKINVIDTDVPEAWTYLARAFGQPPNWNFWKYLVDQNGKLLNAWGPWADVTEIFEEVKIAVDAMFDAKGPSKTHETEPPVSFESEVEDLMKERQVKRAAQPVREGRQHVKHEDL